MSEVVMGSLAQVAQWVNGAQVKTEQRAVTFNRVCTDTRTIQEGDVFVAIKGERFDAHDFLSELELGQVSAVIATHVPDHGSVRSGAVELFLAGATRSAAPDAAFVVHSWIDENGREPDDFAASDPVNKAYVNYYREMGLTGDNAAAFYALTNSVPHEDVLMLGTADLAKFAALN